MKKPWLPFLMFAMGFAAADAAIEGSLDPPSVVESWSETATMPRIIDINFSDTSWPDCWKGETSRDCPDYQAGGYVNAVIDVNANGGTAVKYPVLFHNCTFATKASYEGYAGATAAFCRQYYLGESASGNATWGYNNWTVDGHKNYLEDNIETKKQGRKEVPVYGEAGFVQMCRNGAVEDENGTPVSMHGWMEIDHIPYVERVQWSWSSTSWGRGIKCDIKIGDEPWKPLVWMGSERQKQGWTVFSDQGYFMENVIDAHDVSLRWRVWDGEDASNPVQIDAEGVCPFSQAVDPMAQMQAPRVHKIKIYGSEITAEQAEYARLHPVGDVGELTDTGGGSGDDTPVESLVPDDNGPLAFATAEGFGKYATGGRGGKVVTVTSLADDGAPGTLRWAFDQYKDEPLTIVFAVSGEIALARELRVNRRNWTLAGQTAPGEGVVITHNKVNLGGSGNFIVRNMRFRIGQKSTGGEILAENALGAENCFNFIFDHCSFGWSVEENMNTADSHFLTVQYCMVHEGLYDAGHSKGARGYGCQWGGSPATYHHNLLAHNHSRSCRFNGARGEDQVVFIEYANNVNYNYGSNGGCYGGENTADIADYNGLNSAHECNFMGNYYKPGPGSLQSTVTFFTSSYARSGAKSWAPAQWFVDGNKAHNLDAYTADNWKGVAVEGYRQAQVRVDQRITPSLPYYKYTLIAPVGTYEPSHYMLENIESADAAFDRVVAQAGTVNRDKVEARVAAEVAEGTATYGGATLGASIGFIDTETDAEGFFEYASATAPVDSDGDGMPDAWELANGLDPAVADNNLANSDGYTALEVYLASLMGETLATDFSGIETVIMPVARAVYDPVSRVLEVPEAAVGARLAVYTVDGALLCCTSLQQTRTSLAQLPQGIKILRISARNITPITMKIK